MKGGIQMNPIYDLLRADGSIVINKNLIFAIGLNESIIYAELVSRFNYFSDRDNLTDDGYFFNTINDLQSGTGLGEKPQRTAINNLKQIGLINADRRGIPPKRYFSIIDNEVLLKDLLLQGKNIQAETLAASQLRLLGGIKGSQVAETKTLYGRTNNTKPNNTNLKILNNYNGAKSDDIHTSCLSPYINEIKNTMNYYFKIYLQQTGNDHPKLKKSQIDTVVAKIGTAINEYALDEGNLEDMVDRHFERSIDTDYNINHFATDGILANMMYEVAY